MKTKYQNYKHYKLPITVEPSQYGKIIYKKDKLFIVQFNKTNIAIITQFDNINQVRFYREGDFAFEYKDHIINDKTFSRIIDNKKYTFKNNKLILVSTDENVIYADTDSIL